MTFTQWLLGQPHRGIIFDLAYDARGDKTWPRDGNRDSYLAYLGDCGACDGAIRAFNNAWNGWRRSVRLAELRRGQRLESKK